MGQSLVKNYIHIIFSTKLRAPLILESIENELYSYIGGICKQLECYPVKIGGYIDHIHILCMLSKKIPLMKLLEEIKAHSSKWIKTKDDTYYQFFCSHSCMSKYISQFVGFNIVAFYFSVSEN